MIRIRKNDGTRLKARNNASLYAVKLGINIHPKFQEIIDIALANGFAIPDINRIIAGSRLMKNLDENGFIENCALMYVNVWNDISLENFSKIDWKRKIISTYNGGYIYENFGVRGNKLNAYHDYKFNSYSENSTNYQLNNACDIYYRARKKSAGGTNTVEGSLNNGAQRMDFASTDAEVISRNKINQGTSNCTLITSYQNGQRTVQFSGSATGMMYKKRISSTQIWLGDLFGEQPMTSNSTVLPNLLITGMQSNSGYYDHTQGLVWKGKGTFITYEKFIQFRGFINQFLADLGLPQNA